MQHNAQPPDPLLPEPELSELRAGYWEGISRQNPVVAYLTDKMWGGSGQPASWEVARHSRAVYLFRETRSLWTIVVKYYMSKTGRKALKYALREMEQIERVRSLLGDEKGVKVVEPLGVWRGILFL